MSTKEKKILDSVIYSYSVDSNQLNEENKVLRETINKLKEELDRFKTTPLMVAEVTNVLDGGAMIKLPNGNKFFVNVSNDCEKIKSGDMVLSEQKNLAIIKKIPIT